MRASSNSASSATLTEAKPRSRRAMRGRSRSLSAMLTLAALFFCSQHQLLLLYGDAVAHLHIARRIFDSREPGFRQLGSVWLPLPHLLLVPFVRKMSWWQSGVAAALPSMACYVAACVGLYRLALCFVRHSIAWLAVAFFALNPGLLYLSTTAMTEPLFLAEMIWVALLIALLARRSESRRCGRARDGCCWARRWCWCARSSRGMTDGFMRRRRGAWRLDCAAAAESAGAADRHLAAGLGAGGDGRRCCGLPTTRSSFMIRWIFCAGRTRRGRSRRGLRPPAPATIWSTTGRWWRRCTS